MERFTGYRGKEPLYVGVKPKSILRGSEFPRDKYDKPIDAEVELAAAELELGHMLAERGDTKKIKALQKEIGFLESIVYSNADSKRLELNDEERNFEDSKMIAHYIISSLNSPK